MGAQTEVVLVVLYWMVDQNKSGATTTAQVDKPRAKGSVANRAKEGELLGLPDLSKETNVSGQLLGTTALPQTKHVQTISSNNRFSRQTLVFFPV